MENTNLADKSPESWLDWASRSSQSCGKMRALYYMKSKVFLALGLCTEETFVNEHALPFVTVHHPWPFSRWHHYLLLFLGPALHTQLFHRPPPSPDSINGPVFIASFSRLCDLVTSVCFGYVFSLSRHQNDCHLLHLDAEPPAVMYRPRERAVLLEGRDETVLLYFSIHVFGTLERTACLLFKRLWYSKRKKCHQGTVAALDFVPKAGNSVAILKIKYASPQQLSLWGSQSGSRNSVAHIMWTHQCLFFSRDLKLFSYVLVPQNDSKCKIICSYVSTIFVPLIFILFFSQQALPSTLSGKGKLLVHQLSDAWGTHSSQRIF